MEQITVYLGLGSNLGDMESNLRRGIELLQQKVHITGKSRIYETQPWGYVDQPDFLNCVCRGETALTARDLLSFVKEVELDLGREPTFVNGPRTLDVDILFYGDQVVSETDLEIPHPRLSQRGFVLVPLADLAPGHLHPLLGTTVSELVRNLDLESDSMRIKPWIPSASSDKEYPG